MSVVLIVKTSLGCLRPLLPPGIATYVHSSHTERHYRSIHVRMKLNRLQEHGIYWHLLHSGVVPARRCSISLRTRGPTTIRSSCTRQDGWSFRVHRRVVRLLRDSTLSLRGRAAIPGTNGRHESLFHRKKQAKMLKVMN